MSASDLVPKLSTLIIGGASLVGKAIVRQFSSGGHAVIATHCNSPADTALSSVLWMALDLASEPSIDKFGHALSGARLDKVIFVAGVLPGRSLLDYSYAEMETAMNVNFLGQAKCLKAIMPLLVSPAQILMMSSISGERGSYDPIYAASKGAVIAFVKSLATWLPPEIRCLAIAPGSIVDSGMYLSMNPEHRKAHRDRTPIKELMTADNLAKVIWDLTRSHWAHANGSCVRINGGAYV